MVKKKIIKSNVACIFLGIMVFIYILLFLFSPTFFDQIVPLFIKLLKKMIPVLIGVYLLMFFINLLFKPKKVTRHLGKESGLKGILIASTAGVLSTGPIYIWYPLLADLRNKGMTNKLIVIFLYNRAVKIPLLPMMIYYFGLQFTITLSILMIIFSLLNGWLAEKIIPAGES